MWLPGEEEDCQDARLRSEVAGAENQHWLHLPRGQVGAGNPLRGHGGRPHLAPLLGCAGPGQPHRDGGGPHGGLLPCLPPRQVRLPHLVHGSQSKQWRQLCVHSGRGKNILMPHHNNNIMQVIFPLFKKRYMQMSPVVEDKITWVNIFRRNKR